MEVGKRYRGGKLTKSRYAFLRSVSVVVEGSLPSDLSSELSIIFLGLGGGRRGIIAIFSLTKKQTFRRTSNTPVFVCDNTCYSCLSIQILLRIYLLNVFRKLLSNTNLFL